MRHCPDDQSRRAFLERSGRGLLAIGLVGCAGIPVLTTQVRSGRIEVDRSAFPDLSVPGKGIVVRAQGALEPIILVALPGGGVRALSGICTHLACSLRVAGGGLSCPCHGSTFAFDGTVTRGPAPDDLHVYPTEVIDSTIVITLD